MRRLVTLVLVFLGPLLLRAQTLYLTSGGGNQSSLYTVNPATAQTTLIGPVKVGASSVTITALAFHPTSGVLYGVTGNEYSPSRQLVTIDLTTAAATSLGTIGTTSSQIANDITFAANGELFGWTSRGGPLVSLNLTNAARTVIGSAANGTSSNGLSFTPDGTLYLIGPTANGLFTVDPITGALTSAAALTNVPVNFGGVNGLASDSNGLLYATGNNSGHQLVTIDRVTGLMTTMGTLPFEADALAFQMTAIPEPSAYVAVIGFAAMAVAAWRRSRSRRG